MLDLIKKYKYKIAKTAAILLALYIAISIPSSPNYVEGFTKFFAVVILMLVFVYLRTKDIERKK